MLALEIGIDVVVAGRDQRPALLLAPGGRRHRRAAGGLGQHRLGMRHEVRLGGRDVGGEIGGEGGRVEVQEIVLGGAHVVVGGGRRREQADGTLALVGDESGDVDEADDIGRIARFGDDHPAIAVADQKDGALLQIQHPFGRRDVVGERCQRLLHHADRIAVLAENVGDALPSGAVGEGAVDEDDVLDRLGPRRRDGSRQKCDRRGRSGNGFIRHRALLHDQTHSTGRLNKASA